MAGRKFIPDSDKYFSAAMDIKLPTPKSNNAELIKIARYLLKKIFKQGYRYQKVGSCLTILGQPGPAIFV